jgi:hypothetical protein
MATIADLAKRQAELEAELSQVRAAIAARAGTVDPPPISNDSTGEIVTKPPPPKRTAK